MKNLKIGITISLQSVDEALWTNGIKLNALILIRLLENSVNKYDVCLLNTSGIDLTNKPDYLKDIKIYKFEDKYTEMDLIFTLGAQIGEDQIKHFKSLGDKKVVSYRCGNNFVISMETVLFKPSVERVHQYEKDFDELWYIPQQHETNQGYYHTLYRTDAIMVPFIWHHKYLDESLVSVDLSYKVGKFKRGIKYDIGKEKKVLGIMEPNLNVVKYCMIPLMVAEECYRGDIGREGIEKIMITNSEMVSKHKEFLGQVGTFDLYKDNKVRAESRYQTAYILTQYLDVLICHQLLNPLNYIYLDAAYMGYPVLHNAPMVKDLGYYYEGSDTIGGAKQLDYILTEHDKNIDEYNERNKKVLWRYNADNMELVETYDKMIENLFNGIPNKNLKYNISTNLFDNL